MRILLFVLVLVLVPCARALAEADTTAIAGAVAPCPTVRVERQAAFYLDEDNFKFGRTTDQNYTLGTGFTWGGDESVEHGAHPLLDAPLDGFEAGARWVGARLFGLPAHAEPRSAHYARTLFAVAFTPEHIERPEIQFGDRPYAFLIGWTVARTPDATHAALDRFAFWHSELTLGTIGSPIGEVVQRSIHAAVRTVQGSDSPPDPAGWDHQILDSRWGVPTARYDLSHAWYRRWRAAPAFELLGDAGAEAGYYTDAHASASAAFGWTASPLWTFDVHVAHPGLVAEAPRAARGYEAFVFASVEGFAYAYNALLQGYGDWRSDYRFTRSQIETFTYELRQGIVLGTNSVDAATGHRHQVRLVIEPYAFRSREFKGALARGHSWGGVRLAVGETFELPLR